MRGESPGLHSTHRLPRPEDKTIEMQSLCEGDLANDSWDMCDPFFQRFRGQHFETTRRNRWMDFSVWDFNPQIKAELKFYFAKNLLTNNFSVTTALTTFQRTKQIREYLKTHHAAIRSLMDIDLDQTLGRLRLYLQGKGFKRHAQHKKDFEAVYDFRRIYAYLSHFYDARDEYDKDRWDVRKIPGVTINYSSAHFTLSFEQIPAPFKPMTKRYFRMRLRTKTFGTVLGESNYIRSFLTYIHQRCPGWQGLTELNRTHMEGYFEYLATHKAHTTEDYRARVLASVYNFIEYLQKAQYEEAPQDPAYHLIFKEDMPKRLRTKDRGIKYIPEDVVEQLAALLSHDPRDLAPAMSEKDQDYIPMIILLMETGFRISDVLNLRYHTCLIKTNHQWYLRGDIQKTQVRDHTIPITDAVALMVQACIQCRQNPSSVEHNPAHYLFVRTYGSRRGLPPTPHAVADTLNRWAETYRIRDATGQIFHFRNHAFRHTKAVELINNGMSLLTLQKYMAHCSPEMTMVYAQITDATLKQEWQHAQEQRRPMFQINIATGQVVEADAAVIAWEKVRINLEAAKVPMGYCMASRNLGCPYVETPCLTCHNFCTTPASLPEFDDEVIQTQALIQSTRDMPIWNEKNQRRLEVLQSIRTTLAQGAVHHPAGKARREYP